MVGGKSESQCVGKEQLTSWVGSDLICQDLGVSPEWSDYRPQFKRPKVPSGHTESWPQIRASWGRMTKTGVQGEIPVSSSSSKAWRMKAFSSPPLPTLAFASVISHAPTLWKSAVIACLASHRAGFGGHPAIPPDSHSRLGLLWLFVGLEAWLRPISAPALL